jgi:hypothetical protein
LLMYLILIAGGKAMCSLLWCNHKWATSWGRDCCKSNFNNTKQI